MRPLSWLAARASSAPRQCLLVLALIGIPLAALGLPRLVVNTDGALLENPDDLVVITSREDRVRFNDPAQVILLVESLPGAPSLATPRGLGFIRELDGLVRREPGVHGVGVRSLASLDEIRFHATSLEVTPRLGTIPEDAAGFAAVLERLRSSPWTTATLLSRDGTAAALYVPLAAGSDRQDGITRLRALATRASTPEIRVSLLGRVVAEATLGEAVVADLGRLIPISMLVMAGLLLWRLGSIASVVVPLAQGGCVVVATFATMGLSGVPVTLLTTPLPVLLMALVVVESVHLFERLRAVPDHRESLVQVLAELERPLVATFATTAIGFLSFLATPLEPLQRFGTFGAVGVLIGLALNFTLVPALLTALPAGWRRPLFSRQAPSPLRPTAGSLRWGGWGLVGAAALVLALSPGWRRLEIGDNWLANFSAEAPLVQADRAYNRHFWGSYRLDIVSRGPAETFYTPAGTEWVRRVEELARRHPEIAGVFSYRTSLGEVAQAAGHPDLAALSADDIAGYLTLVQMSTDPRALDQFLTPDGSATRVQLFLAGEDFARDRRVVDELSAALSGLPALAGVTTHLSGDLPGGLAMVEAVVTGQVGSIGITYLVMGLCLLVVYPRGRAALVVLVPVTLTTAFLFAGMGLFAIPLGVATSMFGSLVAEIGVDFGLHLVHTYRGLSGLRDPLATTATTLARVGPALSTTTLVLATGYGVLATSSLRPTRTLGLLLAAAIVCTWGFSLACFPGLSRVLRHPARNANNLPAMAYEESS